MTVTLLYISRSLIRPEDATAAVAGLVADACRRNARDGLTGALLFTQTHFAQVLEGDATAIAALMHRIGSDPRHADLMVVDRGPIAARRFADWSMAYFGPSQFVSRHVTRLLSDQTPIERRRAARWLAELMEEFAMR